VKGLLLAFQFLTIIPIRIKGSVSEEELARSALFFPFVGMLQGLLASLSGIFFLGLFSPEVASLLVLIVLVLTNGGFHLDGLADTFDALAVKSSGDKAKDREKRLAVMKDSATGAIGVVAIVLAVLLKFLLLMEVMVNLPLLAACSIIFLLPLFSKLAMNISLYLGRSARQDGLGRIFIDNMSIGPVLFSFLLTIVFCVAVTRFRLMDLCGTGAFLFFAILLALLYIFSLVATKIFASKFGGLTGDTFGAVSELSEILFLMSAIGWLRICGGESG
jgi:adenosylcobinamide-GDP ribazoletransferase